jgi:hypothetical protein
MRLDMVWGGVRATTSFVHPVPSEITWFTMSTSIDFSCKLCACGGSIRSVAFEVFPEAFQECSQYSKRQYKSDSFSVACTSINLRISERRGSFKVVVGYLV